MFIPAALPTPAMDSTPAVASVVATSPTAPPSAADRHRWLDDLGDKRLWVPPSQQDDLIRQVAAALMAWPAWPRQVGLCVMTGSPSQPLVEDHRLILPRILITSAAPGEPPEFSVSIMRPGKSAPEADVRSFEPPGGLFEAVACGIRMARAWAPLADEASTLPLQEGDSLRQALVGWMRGCPEFAIPLAKEEYLWQLSASGLRDWPPLWQLLAGPVTTPAAPASAEDVRAFAQRLRQGEWSREMEAVLCMWLVRAPTAEWSPPTGVLQVSRADHCRIYARTGTLRAGSWVLRVEPDGRVSRRATASPYAARPAPGPAPDRFLAAYLRGVPDLRASDVGTFRQQVADAMDADPSLCRLLLTIVRRCPDHPDWDYLARQCLAGPALSLEGMQMMAPGFTAWGVSHETAAKVLMRDLKGAHHRLWLFQHGLPLLTFNELLTPLGPSGSVRRAGMTPLPPRIRTAFRAPVEVVPALVRELPWLLHTHLTEAAVAFSLGVTTVRMKALVGGDAAIDQLRDQPVAFGNDSSVVLDDTALARVPVRRPPGPSIPIPGSSGARRNP